MTLSAQQFHAPRDPVAFDRWALDRCWGDGLPLIPPTQNRVEAMIDASGRAAAELVAIVPPRLGMATVETVAINAVMAGCEPKCVAVVIAALEAVADDALNLAAVQATTNPGGPLVIVNGPIRDDLGIAYGADALGPGHRANQTIGRALRVVLRNVGGGYPPADGSIQGSPWKMGLVVGEDEVSSPWEPLHVEYGFAHSENVVTVVNVESVINVPSAYERADSLLTMLARSTRTGLNIHASSGVLPFGLNPGHARMLADAGLTKEEVKKEIFYRARIPVGDLPVEDHPSTVRKREGDHSLVTSSAEDILIFVFGRDVPYHSLYFGGWSISGRASRRVLGGENARQAVPAA